jgi:glycerol-3-phosphate O-acyltransferase
MASLSLIEGVNHIFFPGGTRSRSGAIEDKLKLGLLNSVIDAQRYCIINDIKQKIFVVPMAMSYHFVLEAKSLIDQHLRVEGKEKYVRSKRKGSKMSNLFKFFKDLRKQDSEVYISIGKPMDVLGNTVNSKGQSVCHKGKPVDIKTYFTSDDVLNVDNQRESIYTRILAEKILDSFKAENVILSSHAVAFAMFRCIEDMNPESDLFDILKIPTKNILVPVKEVKRKLLLVISYLETMDVEAKFTSVFNDGIDAIIEDGIDHLGIYHNDKPVYRVDDDNLSSADLKVLYYYHNKLEHYEITK